MYRSNEGRLMEHGGAATSGQAPDAGKAPIRGRDVTLLAQLVSGLRGPAWRDREVARLERDGWSVAGRDERYGSIWVVKEVSATPSRDERGLPLCSREDCHEYDGKRCRALGFRPDRFCEPALLDLLDALRDTYLDNLGPTGSGETQWRCGVCRGKWVGDADENHVVGCPVVACGVAQRRSREWPWL